MSAVFVDTFMAIVGKEKMTDYIIVDLEVLPELITAGFMSFLMYGMALWYDIETKEIR